MSQIEETPLILNYGNIAPLSSVDDSRFDLKKYALKNSLKDIASENAGAVDMSSPPTTFDPNIAKKAMGGLGPSFEDSSVLSDMVARQNEIRSYQENLMRLQKEKELQDTVLQQYKTTADGYKNLGSSYSKNVDFAFPDNGDSSLGNIFENAKTYNIPAANQGPRETTDSLIIHRTAGSGFHPNDTRLTKKGLGAHITIDKDGTIHQIGTLDDKMWHAGPKFNGRSIGIEIVGRHLGGDKWEPLTPAQEKALLKVGGHVVKKYGIPQQNIFNHASVAAKTAGEGLAAKNFFVSNYFGKNGSVTNKTQPASVAINDKNLSTFLSKLKQHESKGDIYAKSKSGKTGLYQFSYEPGSEGYVLANKLGYDINELKTNPEMQENLMLAAMSKYKNELKQAGIPQNNYTYWLRHNQGNFGMKSILSGKLTDKVRNNIRKQGVTGNNDYELIQNYHRKFKPIFG